VRKAIFERRDLLRARGASLPEILVAGGLLVLLLGVVWTLLVPAFRAYFRGDRKSDVQRNGLVVMGRVVAEFQNAYASSVHVQEVSVPQPEGPPVRHDAIIFLSDLDKDGNLVLTEDGDPVWQKRVVIYHDGAGAVRSQELLLAAPAVEPIPLKVENFTPSDRDRVVARHIQSLQFNWSRAPVLHVAVDATHEGYSTHLQSSVTPLLAAFGPPQPSPSASPTSPGP
jgi:hypothetical protein